MKKQYFVLDTRDNEGKFYTVVCPVSIEHDNVISKMKSWAGKNEIIFSMACNTKKRAEEICKAWRQSHIANNNYITF